MDCIFPEEFFPETPASTVIPVYDFTIVDQFGFPIRQKSEVVTETSSRGNTELQSEDEVSLDPTERWNSPVEKRPSDDSGCFLVTDKDGLSQEVSKKEIPVDKTGSSGFWSESCPPQSNMQSYHESLSQDLVEVECSGKSQPLLPSAKTLTGVGCPSSIVNTDSHAFAKVRDEQDTVERQKGLTEITNRTSVSCIVVETDSRTCIRVTMDQNSAPTVCTSIPAMHKLVGEETVEESSDSRSLGSSLEMLSQSSGSNEYINQPRHQVVHPDSTEAQNVSNLLYTDRKGYLRFVTKTTGLPLPVSAQ